MFRVLTILAAIVALAVSAAPVASAGPNSKTTGHSAGLAPDFGIYLSLRKAPPKPRSLDIGTAERLDMNAKPKRLAEEVTEG